MTNLRKGKLQSQYTTVDGLLMHARVSAEPLPTDATVVILVHGLVVSSRYMVPTAELLAPYYRVYAPDLPGYGESEKPKRVLNLSELADALYSWMNAVGIEQATMLGNSFGCQIVVEFATRHPDRIERAILQGPTIDRHTRTFPQQLLRFLLDSPNENPSLALVLAYDYSLAGLERSIRTIQMSLEDQIEEKLPHMGIPTLVVCGNLDPLVPQQWAEEVTNLLPNGKLVVIPGVGHTPVYSAPLELTRVTRAFLNATESHLTKKKRFHEITLYEQTLNSLFAKMRVAPPYIANFDSGSAMLRATSAYLRGEDFPGMGTTPPAAEPLVTLVNKLPRPIQELIYTVGSGSEGIPASRLGDVSAEVVSQWIVNQYPQNQYPAVVIGSSCGALVHLCAALGIPWLPQTFLLPVQHPLIHPDEPKQMMEWGRTHAKPLLDANPELQLHHMHDPSQDRLTVRAMTYFRMKRLRLGATYKNFLENFLPPGGTIFLAECQRTWPTTQIGDRHIFQFGALGGATPEEFFQGSDRVAKYLERYGSHRRRWDAPTPDSESPEAEWGFESALRADVEQFARERGYRVRRIVFQEPEHLSPFVAELYRWWYQQRQILANRLLVESFILLEPMWSLRTGSVPFWMKFHMEPSLNWVQQYLQSTTPYDDIYLILFSNGVDAVGLPTIEQWRTVFNYARRHGQFVGVEEDKFPRNFATLIRYYTDLQRIIPARYPLPAPLMLEQLDQFIAEAGDRFPVHWQSPEKAAV